MQGRVGQGLWERVRERPPRSQELGAGTSGGGRPPRSRADQETLAYTTLEVKYAGTLRNCMKQQRRVCVGVGVWPTTCQT